MNLSTVAFCGQPFAGKATIIHQLMQGYQSYQHPFDYAEFSLNECVDVFRNDRQWRFKTYAGAFIDHHTIIPKILLEADVVVYVMEACHADGRRLSLDPEYEYEFFGYYTAHAAALGKLWTHIPWILVLNKLDLAPQPPPLLLRFPRDLRETAIHCKARYGEGIGELWKRLLTLRM